MEVTGKAGVLMGEDTKRRSKAEHSRERIYTYETGLKFTHDIK